MTNNCGCGHCGCGNGEEKSPEEKIDDLKKAIEELGYKTEETPEGEIKISQ